MPVPPPFLFPRSSSGFRKLRAASCEAATSCGPARYFSPFERKQKARSLGRRRIMRSSARNALSRLGKSRSASALDLHSLLLPAEGISPPAIGIYLSPPCTMFLTCGRRALVVASDGGRHQDSRKLEHSRGERKESMVMVAHLCMDGIMKVHPTLNWIRSTQHPQPLLSNPAKFNERP